MSNTEKNRQIVQEGLERKQTARRQRMTDAAHDAAERQLRTTINQHAMTRRAETEAAEADKRRQEEARRQRAAVREQKAAARAREEKDVKQLLLLTARMCGALLYAALVTFGYIREAISAGMALPTIGLAIIYCVVTFATYVARSNQLRCGA